MPIFEYQCDGCGNKFEKLVRSSQPAVACPSCGDDHVSTQVSSFAARTKGAGGQEAAPSCPSGMCATPGLCGRN